MDRLLNDYKLNEIRDDNSTRKFSLNSITFLPHKLEERLYIKNLHYYQRSLSDRRFIVNNK